ncbi:hypothetical protein QQ045_030357 [Rhodiola kirilowii]
METRSRLDRALVNSQCLSLFQAYSVQHLHTYSSDHKALLLSLQRHKQWRPKNFKFETMWLRDNSFQTLISTEWNSLRRQTTNTSEILTTLRGKIHQWNKHKFGQDGSSATHEAEIQQISVDFYKNLFSSHQSVRKNELQGYLRIVPQKVAADHNSFLLAPYTSDDVTKALFQLNPSKAPGVDGFSASFFQSSWNIVKEDFISECLQFLNQGLLCPDNNLTVIVITLIPKQAGSSKITEYRPISLIGTLAKVISKAIANRLQVLMDEVISPMQCAFIKNRLLTDNILIAQEVTHYVHSISKQKQVYGLLKLDMAKAYDKIEWDFLELILLQLGFSSVWVQRVLHYVKTAHYCLRINSFLSDCFSPSRGLRQGDPLSPYLFILCTEWLSTIMSHYATLGILKGIQICRRAPLLTHLLFADDCLFFLKINHQSVTAVKDVLSLYEKISGQTVNFQKSEIMLSRNASQDLCDFIHVAMGVTIVPKLAKYLGLPLQMDRTRADTFGSMIPKDYSSPHLIPEVLVDENQNDKWYRRFIAGEPKPTSMSHIGT